MDMWIDFFIPMTDTAGREAIAHKPVNVKCPACGNRYTTEHAMDVYDCPTCGYSIPVPKPEKRRPVRKAPTYRCDPDVHKKGTSLTVWIVVFLIVFSGLLALIERLAS